MPSEESILFHKETRKIFLNKCSFTLASGSSSPWFNALWSFQDNKTNFHISNYFLKTSDFPRRQTNLLETLLRNTYIPSLNQFSFKFLQTVSSFNVFPNNSFYHHIMLFLLFLKLSKIIFLYSFSQSAVFFTRKFSLLLKQNCSQRILKLFWLPKQPRNGIFGIIFPCCKISVFP